MKEKNPKNQFKEEISAAFRAISGKSKAHVAFPFTISSHISKPYYSEATKTAVIPMPDQLNKKQIAELRGETDALALFTFHHNPEINSKFSNREFLDRMEELRTEALGATELKGIAQNLAARWNGKIRGSGWNKREKLAEIPASEVVALLVYNSITGSVPSAAKPIMESLGKIIGRKIEQELAQLPSLLTNQRAFLGLISKIASKLGYVGEKESEEKEQQDSPDTENNNSENDNESSGSSQKQASALPEVDNNAKGETPAKVETTSEMQESPGGESAREGRETSDKLNHSNNVVQLYRPYTTKFDQVARAADLAERTELIQHRATLDRKLAEMRDITGRLAAKLQRKLQATQARSWDFNMEEGILDPAKLGAVIVDASYPYPYKWEREAEYTDTIVSLLIDNSGSMRGRPIMIAALCTDILARTLERCGVKVEILGFTTKNWKGGDSKKLWVENGSPSNPGRLNDLLHIIYKDANTSCRQARINLGLMLREGMLKENIDGEAILWAAERLTTRPEKRRILMVISDGAPVDDSTLSANSGDMLDKHLCDVIKYIEHSHEIELLAIGVGHNVNNYYSRAVTINSIDQLAEAMVNQLITLFDEYKPHRRRLRAKTI